MKIIKMNHKPYPFPWYGWLGIASILATQILLLNGSKFVATWMTPLMWTGYILTIDAVVYKMQGTSWIRNRLREVPFLILISVGVWLLFEIYNFHLKNWGYVGLPSNLFVRDIGFFWSFATIMPGVFLTFELLNALFGNTPQQGDAAPPHSHLTLKDWIWICFGLSIIIIPLLLKQETASYLFGLIWVGFIPLLDPLSRRLGAPTISSSWNNSNRKFVLNLLAAGFICGLLWETWNYQAFNAQGAFWVYTIPQPLRIFNLHFGKMPVLGLLGFPPFAIELYIFYHLFRTSLGGDRVFGVRGKMVT
jgi:hypothetical protein